MSRGLGHLWSHGQDMQDEDRYAIASVKVKAVESDASIGI